MKSLVPIVHAAHKWLGGVASGDLQSILDGHVAAVVIALYNLGMLRQPSDPDPIDLLRRLAAKDPTEWDDGSEGVRRCGHCDAEGFPEEAAHSPDCPWVAARAFLDGLTPDPAG